MTHKTKRRRFDLIAFDWDGTLFDSTGLIVRCIQAACRDIGTREPSDMQAAYVIGLGLMDALRHAVPDLPVERYPELGRRYRHHYMARQHEIVLFEGTREMLRSLKARNHWLAVATGKSRLGLNEALEAAQLRQFFDSTRTADETASKPDPLMLLELMGELGSEPERTLMVGDTTHDLQLAANAGVACVGVSYGAHPSEDFHRFSPRFVAHSPRELHAWLHENA
jgi:phosphoglycolate phosphatase